MPALKYWDGTKWVTLAGAGPQVDVSANGPVTRATELLWVDTDEPSGVDPATLLNLRKNGDQALTANTWTTVTSWGVSHAYPAWAAESGAGEFTIPSSGYYRIDFTWMSANVPDILHAAQILINGLSYAQFNMVAGTVATHCATSTWFEGNLAAGDKIIFQVHQGATGTLLAGSGGSGYAATNAITRAVIRKVYSGGIPASGGSPDTAWAGVTFQNGWTNYDVTNWAVGQYRRIAGVTYLRGLVKPGTVNYTTPIFTLPPGFRPSANIHIAAMQGGAFGLINAWPDGRICANVASTTYYTLDGVSFPADL